MEVLKILAKKGELVGLCEVVSAFKLYAMYKLGTQDIVIRECESPGAILLFVAVCALRVSWNLVLKAKKKKKEQREERGKTEKGSNETKMTH